MLIAVGPATIIEVLLGGKKCLTPFAGTNLVSGTALAAGIAAIDRTAGRDANALPLTKRHTFVPFWSDTFSPHPFTPPT